MLEQKGRSNMAVINLQDGKPQLGRCTVLRGIQKLLGQYFGTFSTTCLTIQPLYISQLKNIRKFEQLKFVRIIF